MNGDFDLLAAVGVFLGGLGLFMLGVSMITDGLKLAAGNTLRDILARSTRTRMHGMMSGALFTAMVQSSSAVTIATIGFVNAGLLAMAAALSIVLGATIGTTMTGWLVSAVGFQFKITAFALPMLGVGMFLRLLGPSRRSGAFGEALAGFGLFFIGIDFLRNAFEDVALAIDIASLHPDGIIGTLIFVGIGLMMTVLTQSSSAAIAIILTAASGGLIGIAPAAAAVIGATIGTTSTSALAVIGATANARRVAAGHVLINSFNALIGVALLPALLWMLTQYPELVALPAFTLAAFHTTFNLTGVVLIQPFLNGLANWLDRRFQSAADALGRPQYLDRNIMVSPDLALDAFVLELQRMSALARAHARAALSQEGPPGRDLQLQHDGLRKLVVEVEHAVAALEAERLHANVAVQLPLILRIANYIDELVSQAQENAENDQDVEYLLQTAMRDRIVSFQLGVIEVLDHCDLQREDFDASLLEARFEALRMNWRDLKSAMLNAGVRREIPMQRLNPAIDSLRVMLRVAERSTRLAVRLHELVLAVPALSATPEPAPDVPADAVAPTVDGGATSAPDVGVIDATVAGEAEAAAEEADSGRQA